MAVQGKKINELTAIGTVSNETVLPAVYVSGTTVNSTANKISIEQISTKVQDDMSTALAGKQDTLVSGTNIKTINNESLLGSGNLDVDGLPSQSGQSGKFLTTDGTNASWAQVSTPESGADTSLSNLTNAGKIQSAHLAMPSGTTYEDLTLVSGEYYQMPYDGYVYIAVTTDSTVYPSSYPRFYISLQVREAPDGSLPILYQTGSQYVSGKEPYGMYAVCLPVKKGLYVRANVSDITQSQTTLWALRMIPAVGSESEQQ